MTASSSRPDVSIRRVSHAPILAVHGRSVERREDTLVGEEPLEIRAAGPGQEPVAVAVTMRTPGSEDELAIGFLRTEGLINDGDVAWVEFGGSETLAQPDDTVIVRLRRGFDASLVAERHFVATASCGICGKATLDEIAIRCDPIPAGRPRVNREVILGLPAALRDAQEVFEQTGGLHAAGLFEPDGRLIALREDVGRHNALDKLIGWAVMRGRMPLNGQLLMVSGRISLEIVQKAAVAGIPMVCAVSAPSDLALEAAERFGQTLIGFLRGDSFNVYAGAERIDLTSD